MSGRKSDPTVVMFLLVVILLVVSIGVLLIVSLRHPTASELFWLRNQFVEECEESERYDRDDCIIMSGKWNP